MGFGTRLADGDAMASVLHPYVIGRNGEIRVAGAVPLVEHLIAGGDPVGALHRIVSDRRRREFHHQAAGSRRGASHVVWRRRQTRSGPPDDRGGRGWRSVHGVYRHQELGQQLVVTSRATGRKTDLRAARVLDAWLSSGGSKEEMGLADYVFLRRQLGKPCRLVRACSIRNTVTGNASQPAPDRSGPSSAMPPGRSIARCPARGLTGTTARSFGIMARVPSARCRSSSRKKMSPTRRGVGTE